MDLREINLDKVKIAKKKPSNEIVSNKSVLGSELQKIKSQHRAVVYKKIHTEKIKYFKKLVSLPRKNEQFCLITQNNINGFSFLLYVLETEKIKSLYITTYNIKGVLIDNIFDLLNRGKIENLVLVVSESIRNRTPHIYQQLQEQVKNSNKKTKKAVVKLMWSHCKIFLVETEKNNYVMEGSGNLSDNTRIESYRVDNSNQIFDFHKNWIDETLKENSKKRELIIE